ncbi:dolichyl-phosphate-mannose-protein mannosyltransferase [Leptospira broomii serovar Hurstbridge str. 5399]|uniref:Dolichyl-phosphate-mannose-protein mannosyltransferase n=1 Tax=Leptospira broomii serovar Hurstbridge str. 5399 TaxID=1049789 RepID=T0F2K3_9LEPT|nr:glycosyltransferase family 39 protein [Leptospira broomii]EQA45365.1 dolichyl-phosphate-mannose-protein mannosyltransferase [Leptospira broomii serovar Hurstbridge str. 5399]
MKSPEFQPKSDRISGIVSLFGLVILSILYLFAFGLSGKEFPPTWPDEVLFYSPSMDFATHGTFRTLVLEGLIRGMEYKTLWVPPLFFILNGAVLSFFGGGLEVIRQFSALVSLGSVWLFWFLLKEIGFSPRARLGACLLLITDLLFLRVGWTARMEALCLFWALASIFVLARKVSWNGEAKNELTFLEGFGSGFFLGLSFLSHPFGAVFGIPVLFLIHRAKAWNIWTFWVGGSLPLIAWAIWIYPDWELFIIQFGAQFGRKRELLQTFSPLTKVKVLLGGYESPGSRLWFYLALLLGVWVVRKELLERKNLTFFLLLWLSTVLAFLFLSTEYYYVMYLCLPLSALGGFFFDRIRSRRIQYVAGLLVFCNLFILFYAYRKIGFANPEFDLNAKFSKALLAELEGSKRVYLQAIPDPYFHLVEGLPDSKILEFIPGELPIPSNEFLPTLQTIDAFVFSEGQKRNEHIQRFLEENSNKFKIRSVSVEPSTPRKLVKAEAVIYLRR